MYKTKPLTFEKGSIDLVVDQAIIYLVKDSGFDFKAILSQGTYNLPQLTHPNLNGMELFMAEIEAARWVCDEESFPPNDYVLLLDRERDVFTDPTTDFAIKVMDHVKINLKKYVSVGIDHLKELERLTSEGYSTIYEP